MIALDVAYGELHWRLRNDARVTVIERRNARSLEPDELPYAPDLIVADVSFISLTKVLPAVVAAAAPRFDCSRMVKPQFEVGRERVGKGGVVRSPDDRRAALSRWASTPRESWALSVLGYASSGLPGPAGNRETLRLDRRARPRGRAGGPRGRRAKGGAVSRPPRSRHGLHATRGPEQTGDALRRVIELAREAGVEVRVPQDEVEKHGIEPADGVGARRRPGRRHRPRGRAGRRRHDPHHAAAATPAGA